MRTLTKTIRTTLDDREISLDLVHLSLTQIYGQKVTVLWLKMLKPKFEMSIVLMRIFKDICRHFSDILRAMLIVISRIKVKKYVKYHMPFSCTRFLSHIGKRLLCFCVCEENRLKHPSGPARQKQIWFNKPCVRIFIKKNI